MLLLFFSFVVLVSKHCRHDSLFCFHETNDTRRKMRLQVNSLTFYYVRWLTCDLSRKIVTCCSKFFFSFFVFLTSSVLLVCWINIVGPSDSIPGPEVIKFSCSTQLSTTFQLLIETKIPTNKEVSCF